MRHGGPVLLGEVRGTVGIAGPGTARPLPGATVEVRERHGTSFDRVVRTDANGLYLVSRLDQARAHRVQASARFAIEMNGRVTNERHDTVTCDGAPLEEALVEWRHLSEGRCRRVTEVFGASTNAAGRYSLSGLLPGTYEVVVEPPGRAPVSLGEARVADRDRSPLPPLSVPAAPEERWGRK